MRLSDQQPEEEKPGMEINLDRPKRVRNTVAYWLVLLGVAGLLTVMLARFTGSIWVALALSGGMLTYMLIVASITSKNLGKSPGDGRLD